MPDRWGRPNFNDGAALAQGIMSVQDFQRRQEADQAEKDSYSVAEALEAGDDISVFSDEAKYKGAKLKYNKDLDGISKQIKEMQLSNEGRQQKMMEMQEIDATGKRLFNQYQAARRSGNDDMARKIARRFNNEVAYNGVYIPETETGTGKLSIVRQATGQKEKIEDLPIEQYDSMISGYMNVPPEEMQKRMISGEQYRMKRNLEIISQAEPLINSRGDVIYKVPSGTWDKKDSSLRGAFYIDSPVSQKEIPPEKAKKYKPLKVAKTQAEIGTKRASAAAHMASARKNSIVDPRRMVSGKGEDGVPQQGLIVQGSGGPQFQEVEGVPQQALNPQGPMDPAKAKSAYDLQVKRMNTVLMPFNKTEAPIFEKGPDGSFRLAEGGHNALNAAWKLTQRSPDTLSPQESNLMPYAQQAVQMYKQLTQENAQEFGLNAGQEDTAGQSPNRIRMVYDSKSGRLIPK